MESMEHKHNPEEGLSELREEVVMVDGGTKPDRFLPVSIIIAAVVIGGSILFSALYKGSGFGAGAVGAAVQQGQQQGTAPQQPVVAQNAMVLSPRDAILGNQNAKVTIVEYGDYQCPFCTRFFSQSEPQLVQNYVQTGKVRMVFRDFAFLGVESTAAAQAAQCANDQGKLWAYHDALYAAKVADEQKGGNENDGFYNRAEFVKLAQQVGLDANTFASCIDSNKEAAYVAQEKTSAGAVGVNSTPTFYVNGQQILGAQPYSQFQTMIDAALKG